MKIVVLIESFKVVVSFLTGSYHFGHLIQLLKFQIGGDNLFPYLFISMCYRIAFHSKSIFLLFFSFPLLKLNLTGMTDHWDQTLKFDGEQYKYCSVYFLPKSVTKTASPKSRTSNTSNSIIGITCTRYRPVDGL